MSKTVASFVRWLGTVMIRFWGWIGALSTAIFLLDYIATLQPFIDCLMGHEHRWWFFVGGLFALLFSSFLAWRAEEQQLKHFKMPSLKLQFNPAGDNFIRTVPSSTGLLTYVRVLPTTESRVNNCTGRLLRIERWDGENGYALPIAKPICWSGQIIGLARSQLSSTEPNSTSMYVILLIPTIDHVQPL